jgi:uncharacterized membrane protein YtjA (UPF0391 family)
MPFYTWTLLLVAMIAGVLGFGLIPFKAGWIAKTFFFVFFGLYLVRFSSGSSGEQDTFVIEVCTALGL